MNRILWNEEAATDPAGQPTIDEIVVHKATVHFEQMDTNCYWLGITIPDTEQRVDVNFWADGNQLFCTLQEDTMQWEKVDHHADIPEP